MYAAAANAKLAEIEVTEERDATPTPKHKGSRTVRRVRKWLEEPPDFVIPAPTAEEMQQRFTALLERLFDFGRQVAPHIDYCDTEAVLRDVVEHFAEDNADLANERKVTGWYAREANRLRAEINQLKRENEQLRSVRR